MHDTDNLLSCLIALKEKGKTGIFPEGAFTDRARETAKRLSLPYSDALTVAENEVRKEVADRYLRHLDFVDLMVASTAKKCADAAAEWVNITNGSGSDEELQKAAEDGIWKTVRHVVDEPTMPTPEDMPWEQVTVSYKIADTTAFAAWLDDQAEKDWDDLPAGWTYRKVDCDCAPDLAIFEVDGPVTLRAGHIMRALLARFMEPQE